MNKIVLVLLLVVVVGGGYLLLSDSGGGTIEPEESTVTQPEDGDTNIQDQQKPEGQPEESADTMEEEDEGGNVVTYTDDGYSPETISVSVGETVTFRNESSREMWTASDVHPTHGEYAGTTLSEHCPDPENEAFDACEGTPVGESWTFTFDKAGTWSYHNHLGPADTGTVDVTE